MMTAMTPSLNASSRPLPITPPRSVLRRLLFADVLESDLAPTGKSDGMRMIIRKLAGLGVLALASSPSFAAAQAAPSPAPAATAGASAAAPSDPCTSLSSLVSRPTFGTAACAVKKGDLLFESGYTNLTSSGAGASNLVTVPQGNIRVGLGGNLEFDLGPPSIGYLSGAPRAVGITDGSIGLKEEIGYSKRAIYGMNVVYTLPVGSANVFSANGGGIFANVNGALTLSPSVGLFATLGYNAQNAGTIAAPARYHDYQPSLGASVSLPQNFYVFLEGFDVSSTGPGLGGRFGYDTGFQKDIGSRLQLDFNYYDYLGAQSGQHQHSIGLGAAYLIGS
ncbi:MAG: hypothetical protein GIX03_07725 [Candidatus Eremiobacteraeota bacterium]|nr:hypothetical protein [Candidatus Eremiobacteraeota bacterium]